MVFTLDGEIRALSAVCTHQGCTLVPEAAQRKLVCPCHPMSFNLTGAANPGDYRLNPLPAIETRVNAGQRRGARPRLDLRRAAARPAVAGRVRGSDPAPGAVRTKR